MAEPWPPLDESESWQVQRPGGPYAGFGPRLGAWVVDVLLVGFSYSILDTITNGFGDVNREMAKFDWRAYAIVSFLSLTYATLFIGSMSGQTVGMRLFAIRALDVRTLGRVDYGRCMIRYFVSMLSSAAFLLGFFWMLGDPKRQTWHDKAAGTIVVPVAEYPVEKWPR